VDDFELNYVHEVAFDDVPLAWTTRFELFSPDLEQFPLMYVHRKIEPIEDERLESPIERVYGFPLNATIFEEKGDGCCIIIVKFLCNAPQGITSIDEVVFEELNHRLGLANKVGYGDLDQICRNSPENLPLLQTIWKDKITRVYGGFIPHGRIFDEVYGIIRFSASGNAPRLGKTSELRMLYWYMKDIGQPVSFGSGLEQFDFCEFYLLPTIEETRMLDFRMFPVFFEYYNAIKAFWEMEYTETFNLQGYDFHYADGRNKLPLKGADFESRYESGLPDYYDQISRLRQIFNRMPARLYGYIWNMMTFIEVGFKEPFSKREALQSFVKDHHDKKGSSSKVLACILQQCFGLEALPIDTWVKTFIYYPLAISPTNNGKSNNPSDADIDKLYNSFRNLDKLEKLIWVSSMGNKTNKTEFEDILWCQRYGTDMVSKGPCRGANPLSCSQCSIRDHCRGFNSISDQMVVVSDDQDIVEAQMIDKGHLFGILTHAETPRQVTVLERRKAVLRDAHTGFAISTDVKIPASTYKVSDFISKIEP
jgi:hypothetical protein